MTKEEIKANELIERFRKIKAKDRFDLHFNDYEAAQLSIICVDEILESQPSKRYWDTYGDEEPSAITFWQSVKQILESK